MTYQTLELTTATLSQAFNQQSALTRSYVNLYEETKITLAAVNRELESTTDLLTQTENMLQQARTENASLKDQVLALQNNLQMTDQVSRLMDESTKAKSELVSLQSQMRAVDDNFEDIDRGKSMIAVLQKKIQVIKDRIHQLKQEASVARKAAEEEMDRLALLNGNQGFITKDGQAFKPPEARANKASGVQINVSFYEQ